MHNLYKKADQSPVKTAAYLKAAISMLEPLMQASEPHSTEGKELSKLLSDMQLNLDAALQTQMREERIQLDAGLITYEEYANAVARTIAFVNVMYADIKAAAPD